MARAAIYARISKDAEQTGLGVDRQLTQCRELAARKRLKVVAEFAENDVSAYRSTSRPAWRRLWDLMEAGEVDVLIGYAVDRLLRSPRELEDLVDLVESTGITVLAVNSGEIDLATANGRHIGRILGATARAESEKMSERLKAQTDQAAKRGAAPGGRPPYGYDRAEGTYTVNAAEAKVVRRIAKAVDRGDSLLAIARALNDDGVPTREGRPWHHSTVRAVVVNPAVAGRRVHRRQVVGDGNWKPILNADEFDKRVAVLADPVRKRKRVARRYLLTGVMVTHEGAPMVGRGAEGKRPQYVTITEGYDVTGWVSIDAERIETAVVETVLAHFDRVALRPVPVDKKGNAESAADIEKELDDLARLRAANKITLQEWLIVREGITERLERAQRTTPARRLPDYMTKVGGLRRRWPDLSFDDRRGIIGEVVERVTVGPAPRGRWTPIDERVEIELAKG